MPLVALMHDYPEALIPALRTRLPEGWRLQSLPPPPETMAMDGVLAEVDFLLAWDLEVTARMIYAAPRLKLIQRVGSGLHGVDLVAARRKGVAVADTPAADAATAAELGLLLLLAMSWRVRDWQLSEPAAGPAGGAAGRELAGKQVGLLGLDPSAQELALRVSSLRCLVGYYDQTRLSATEEQALGLVYLPRYELFCGSDFVSVHTSPAADRQGRVVGREEFRLMRRSAMLLDLSAGSGVDYLSLYQALANGWLGAAALDSVPPGETGEALARLSSVIVAPRAARRTEQATTRATEAAVANLLRVERGEPLLAPL